MLCNVDQYLESCDPGPNLTRCGPLTEHLACITTPVGREFVTIPIPTEQFKSGQTVETILVFAGSEGEDIEFTTKVLATPGER